MYRKSWDSCSQADDRKIVQVVVDKGKGGLDEEREIKWLYLEMSISRLMQETRAELMRVVLDSYVVNFKLEAKISIP